MLYRRLAALAVSFAIVGFPLVSSADQIAGAQAPVPGMTGSQIDADAQVNAFKDVPANSWAYQAIVQLANDGIINGYPDGTFKGNRPITRYEAALMVERAVKVMTDKLRTPATAPEVTAADITALRNLLDEFRGDIVALRIKVGDIDDRLKKVEATQDRAQIHAVYLARAGSSSDSVSAFLGDGRALQANTALPTANQVGTGGNAASNRYIAGQNTNGYGYQILRLQLDGNLDKKTSYHTRIENVYNWDASNSTQAGGAFPGSVFASSPSGGFPRSTTVRLNYAYLDYKDPSGFSASAGRLNETDGTLGLAWADQFNGIAVGYTKNALSLRGGYAFAYPSYNSGGNTCTYAALTSAPSAPSNGVVGGPAGCGTSQQTIFGTIGYNISKQLTVGASYIADVNDILNAWNPSVCSVTGKTPVAGTCPLLSTAGSPTSPTYTGAYQPVAANLSVGTIYGRYTTPKLSLEAEGLMRFGKDPFTGATWKQNNALWLQAKYGQYTPKANRSYVEGGLAWSGFNSTGMHNGIVSATNYEGQFLGNPNGYQIGYAGVQYWFSQFARIGLVYNAYNLLHGTTYPVASALCAGCFLTQDKSNALFLQTYLQF